MITEIGWDGAPRRIWTRGRDALTFSGSVTSVSDPRGRERVCACRYLTGVRVSGGLVMGELLGLILEDSGHPQRITSVATSS